MEIHDLAILLEENGTGIEKAERNSVAKGRLATSDLKLFAETLGMLLEGGVPILKALEGLEKASPGKKLKSVLTRVRESIQQGAGFSEALERTGNVPAFFHQIVYTGEISGRVPAVLQELAKYMGKEETLKRKIREALVYPGFILSLGLVTLGVLLYFVLPRLRTVYEGFGTELPAVTKMILGLSDSLLPLIALFFIAGLFLTGRLLGKKDFFAQLLYRAPFLGNFLQGFVRVRFSRLLSLLLESGIPVLQALEVVEKTFSRLFIRRDIVLLKEGLAEGRGFSKCVDKMPWMDSLSRMLVGSGEEAGRLGASFAQIARDTEISLEARIELLMKLLEPGLILAIGLLVGFVVIATMLPIFDMSGLVR